MDRGGYGCPSALVLTGLALELDGIFQDRIFPLGRDLESLNPHPIGCPAQQILREGQ